MTPPALFVIIVVPPALTANAWFTFDVPVAWMVPEFVMVVGPLAVKIAILPLPPVCWTIPLLVKFRLFVKIVKSLAAVPVIVAPRLLVIVPDPREASIAATPALVMMLEFVSVILPLWADRK